MKVPVTTEEFYCGLYSKYRPMTLSAFIGLNKHYLKALRQVHPLFEQMAYPLDEGFKQWQQLSEELNELDLWLPDFVNDPEENCDLRAEDGGLTSGSICDLGYRAWYSTYNHDLERITKETVTRCCFHIHAGTRSSASPDATVFSLPRDKYGPLHKFEIARKLLLTGIEQLAPHWAILGSHKFRDEVNDEDDKTSIGWLTYFLAPGLADCLPDDIDYEILPNGGTLIITTRERCSADNPEHVAQGKRIRKVLDRVGLIQHSECVIYGWPHDEEETRYQQILTGTPERRKYRVGCVDFDGYDAERKTLLFTRLFRGLKRYPKGWGIRGLDGPVLNEANRQVNAAQGYPIEWHIGLEEPYEKVRELLADYTDITEEQIRVIYTPLEPVLRNFDQESDKNHT